MAFEDKKYLDLTGLTTYDGKIKAHIKTADDAVLQGAKDYADGLAGNYEPAGTVATAQEALQKGIDAAQDAAAKAQGEVDALEILVGTLPEGTTATSVVDYVNVKTAGIATESAMTELAGRVTTVEGKVATIESDYLKAADKTELADDIADEAARATAAEKANADAIKAVSDDYLKAADKTELQGNIDTVSGKVTTLIGEDAGKSARTIANEELAKQLIAEGAQESLDTLAEIAAWIQEHPEDASAMSKAIDDLETLVGALPEGVTATTIVGYIQEAVAAEQTRATGVEGGLDTRLKAVEAQLGEGEGSVADQIADAKAEAIADANAHADGLNTAMDTRVKAVEAKAHEHANKELLDTYTQTEANLADAVAKKHAHANAAVIDGITADQVTAWDAALQAADITTGGANGTIAVKGADVAVKGLGSAAFTEAAAYEVAGAAAAAQGAAKTYTDEQVAALEDSFVAITTTDINNLFTATA